VSFFPDQGDLAFWLEMFFPIPAHARPELTSSDAAAAAAAARRAAVTKSGRGPGP